MKLSITTFSFDQFVDSSKLTLDLSNEGDEYERPWWSFFLYQTLTCQHIWNTLTWKNSAVHVYGYSCKKQLRSVLFIWSQYKTNWPRWHLNLTCKVEVVYLIICLWIKFNLMSVYRVRDRSYPAEDNTFQTFPVTWFGYDSATQSLSKSSLKSVFILLDWLPY